MVEIGRHYSLFLLSQCVWCIDEIPARIRRKSDETPAKNMSCWGETCLVNEIFENYDSSTAPFASECTHWELETKYTIQLATIIQENGTKCKDHTSHIE